MCIRTSTHREGLACVDPVVGIPQPQERVVLHTRHSSTWETGAGVQASVGHSKNLSKGINKEKRGREGRTGRGKEK